MSKEAMKLALEALVNFKNDEIDAVESFEQCETAITALREALAEQPAQQQEPKEAMALAMSWIHANGDHDQLCDILDLDDDGKHKPCSCGLSRVQASLREALAEQPAQPKPLGYAGITIWGGDATVTKMFTETEMKFAREPRSLIESVVGQLLDELAAHNIKENT